MKMKPLRLNLRNRLYDMCESLTARQRLWIVVGMLAFTLSLSVMVITRSVIRLSRGFTFMPVDYSTDTTIYRDVESDTVTKQSHNFRDDEN